MIPSFAYYVMALRRDFIEFCNVKLQEIGLSQGQVLFLIYIGKHDYCSPKELAYNLHMDSGHAARTIMKLVKSDFLVQEVNPKDKRSHSLTLTDKGKVAFQTCYDLFSAWDKNVMSDISGEQQTQLLSIMAKVIDEKRR